MTDLVVLNDEPVNHHFPAHYRIVYLDLLEEKFNLKTKMIVTEIGDSDFNHKNILLKLKKSSTKNIIKRVYYSIYLMLNLFKILIFDKRLKGMKYIMVHDDPIMAYVAYMVSKFKNIKFIYRITHLKVEEVRQLPNTKAKILSGFAKFLRNYLLKKADAVIVMSDIMKIYFEKVVKRKIYSNPSCIDYYYNNISEDIPEKVQEIKNKVNKESLCYLGTISRFRGLEFIIDVMSNLHNKGIKKELNIFGKGSDEDFIDLRNKIIKLNLEKYIFIYHQLPMNHLKYILEDVKIGLSPYLYEHNYVLKYNSPLKTLDYMNFGMFVVGSNIDDHYETIFDSKSGEVCKNNIEDYTNAIIRLEDKLKKLNEVELEAKINVFSTWLEKNRSLKISAKKVINILDSIS